MAQLTNNEINALLRGCTHYSSQSRTYTRLLGFNQLSHSKRESGKQKFTGIVQELHDAANEEVTNLTEEYMSRKEVQQDVSRGRSALQKRTDACLEPYGPKIWGNGQNEPFVTHVDQYYRQRLIWDDLEDRKRLRLYFFCWIIQRTCRKVEAEKREYKKSACADEDDAFASEGEETRSIPNKRYRDMLQGLNTSSIHHAAESARASGPAVLSPYTRVHNDTTTSAPDFRAPEAPMICNPLAHVSKERPVMGDISLTINAQQGLVSAVRSGRSENFEDSAIASPDGVQGDDDPLTTRKRRWRSIDETREDTAFSSLLVSGAVRASKRKGLSGRLCCIFPPAAMNNDLEFEPDLMDHPPTPRSNDHVSTVSNGIGGSELPINQDAGDVDSVQGDAAETEVTEPEPTPPVLQASHLRRDRKRLALDLHHCFMPTAELRTPLETTINLIGKLWTTDKLRLREAFGHASGFFNEVLGRWLQYIGILARFQDLTDFRGDQEAWSIHLDGLQNDARSEAREHLLEAGLAMDDWLSEQQKFSMHEFSKDVAIVLLAMADWMGSMNHNDRELFMQQVTRFNESLLARFES